MADGAALVDFFVESAWSVRDGFMPNCTVDLRMVVQPGDEFNIELAAIDAGWIPRESVIPFPTSEGGFSSAQVWVDLENTRAESRGAVANVERLGPWPGDAPVFPEGVIVLRDV